MTKTCRLCLTDRPIVEFYIRENGKTRTECKSCLNAKSEVRRKANWDVVREKMRQYAASHKELRQEIIVRHRTKYPEKYRARNAVNNAIRDGRLERQPCWCGQKAQAHHHDYSQMLSVTWLCSKHHAEEHMR